MDKRELKIDYFVCRNSVPACYEELSEKALAAAGKNLYDIEEVEPEKLIASIPILLSERLFCWKMERSF